MGTPRRVLLVLAASLAAASGCRRPAQAPASRLDLAPLAFSGDLHVPGDVVVFGTPAAERWHRAGLAAAAAEPGLDPHALGRRKVAVALSWPDVRDRTALLDVAPAAGLAQQACDVALNDRPLARITMSADRARHAVVLPRAAQQAGENLLELRCDHASERTGRGRQKPALRLFSLAVLDPGHPSVREPGPPLLSSGPDGAVLQAGPSSLDLAVQLPGGGDLVFTPAPQGSAAPSVSVHAEALGAPAAELWRQTLAGAGPAVRLRLPAAPLLRLRLTVDAGAVAWRDLHVLSAAAPAASPAPATGAVSRPHNIVLVLLDAAGARHFNAYGYRERRTTPNVDRLAREGVLFEDAYSPAGFTVLAMGSLWTSMHPDELHNAAPPTARLPRSAITVPELLNAAGFRTAGFVRNPQAGRLRGMERGFDEFEEEFRGEGRGANALRSVVPAWIERHKADRFFLYVHLREPHFPYKPPPEIDAAYGPPGLRPRGFGSSVDWLARVNGNFDLDEAARRELTRLYDGNLAFADDVVGSLRAALEQHGLLDRTAVIVTGDHGESMGQHGFVGHEDEVYGEVTHVPLVVRAPGVPAGVRVPGLVDLSDVGATIAALGGVADHPSARASFRGRALLPPGAAPPRPYVVSRTPDDPPRYALRDAQFVYHLGARRGVEELYDARADPGERHDLSGREPLRTMFYRQLLRRFVLEKRRGPASAEDEPELTPEQAESLRALGYVQ